MYSEQSVPMEGHNIIPVHMTSDLNFNLPLYICLSYCVSEHNIELASSRQPLNLASRPSTLWYYRPHTNQ